MVWMLRLAGLACAGLLLSSVSALAGPKVVSGPGADPRHLGFREVIESPGNSFKITEVVGNWDTGTSHRR
jgi:hypothetical protein